MVLLVISDLHIGADNKSDIFGWKNYRFITTIGEIIEKHRVDKIILNGDIYEMYQHNYSEIYERNQIVCDLLKGEIFYHIKGNHDAFSKFGNRNFFYRNAEGKTIYIEHGHNADILNGTLLGMLLGRLTLRLIKKLSSNKFIERLHYRIIEYNDQLNRIPRKYDRYKYLKYALRLLKRYDVVILGHTHKLEEHKTWYINNKKAYLNCGTCSLGRFQGIVLDTETLKYKVVKINKDKNKKDSLLDKSAELNGRPTDPPRPVESRSHPDKHADQINLLS